MDDNHQILQFYPKDVLSSFQLTLPVQEVNGVRVKDQDKDTLRHTMFHYQDKDLNIRYVCHKS
jgi:hypothetical protein